MQILQVLSIGCYVLWLCCLDFKIPEKTAKNYLLGDIKFLEKLFNFDVKKILEIRFMTFGNNLLGDEILVKRQLKI